MEGPDTARNTSAEKKVSSPTSLIIYHYLEDEANVKDLLGTLIDLVHKFGLARQNDYEAVKEMANELLSDVVAEVLASGNRYDPQRRLAAWLYGVAVNIAKRKKAEQRGKRYKQEVLFSDVQLHDTLPNDDVLDLLSDPQTVAGPEQEIEINEQFDLLISPLPQGDQQMLRLAFLHDMDHTRVAKKLGITQDAARQRFHRSLKRLRTILEKQKGEYNG